MYNILADVTPPLFTTSDSDSANPTALILIILAVVVIIVVICLIVGLSSRGKNTSEPPTQESVKEKATEFENLSEEEKQLLREHRQQKTDNKK